MAHRTYQGSTVPHVCVFSFYLCFLSFPFLPLPYYLPRYYHAHRRCLGLSVISAVLAKVSPSTILYVPMLPTHGAIFRNTLHMAQMRPNGLACQ